MAFTLSLPRVRRPSACQILLIPLVLVLVLLGTSIHLYRGLGVSDKTCRDARDWKCQLEGSLSGRGSASRLVAATTESFVSSVGNGSSSGTGYGRLSSVWQDAYRSAAGLLGKHASAAAGGGWSYRRDADNLGMTSPQCQAAFPGLFDEITRARSNNDMFHIIQDELDAIRIANGRIRASILEGKVGFFMSDTPVPLVPSFDLEPSSTSFKPVSTTWKSEPGLWQSWAPYTTPSSRLPLRSRTLSLSSASTGMWRTSPSQSGLPTA